MYRRLERSAWLDVFPDSDAYGGKTDVKGHELTFKLGLDKRLTLELDYHHIRNFVIGIGDFLIFLYSYNLEKDLTYREIKQRIETKWK